jgi:hypothetical protein
VKTATESLQKYGHEEFVISYDDRVVSQPDIDWLLTFLERQVSDGVRYKPGETIQIGWMFVRVGESEAKLVLSEPDLQHVPIVFVSGVTRTLCHLRLQKSIAESLGLADCMEFPTIQDGAIKCSRFKVENDFVMARSQPAPPNSGWFFGCSDPHHDHNDPQNLWKTSLYQVVCGRHLCVAFLALPFDSAIQVNGKKIEAWLGDEELSTLPGSLLSQFAAFRE